jgi:hypothetical protein
VTGGCCHDDHCRQVLLTTGISAHAFAAEALRCLRIDIAAVEEGTWASMVAVAVFALL